MNTVFKQFLSDNIAEFGIPSWRILESSQGAKVCIDGKWKISFCSNNYLGLSNHPSLKKAASQALEKYGVGTVAARSLSGSTLLHEALEEKIAEFKCTEKAMVFNSGFVTNTGVIPALVGKGCAVFSDDLNHGSIIDGCRLSGAEKYIYRHGDLNQLEKQLKDATSFLRRLIIVDAVFSMDGDIAPLPEIVELAEDYNAIIMVDEAHSTGVLGKNSKGILEHFGVEGRVDIVMGTLGKALGSVGGYIAGTQELISYLSRTARSFLLSTSLPAPCIAAALAGLRIVDEDRDLHDRLWNNTKYYRSELNKIGFNTMESKTPIVPILIGSDNVAQNFCDQAYDKGLYLTKIGSPYVAEGTARVRTIISAVHKQEDLEKAITILKKVGQNLKII